MTKKNSSKTSAAAIENSVVKESLTPRKPGLEIDEIFSTKSKKSEQEKAEEQVKDVATKANKKKSLPNTPALENHIVKEDGPSPTSKKPGNEIDEIFSTKKRKKAEQGKGGKQLEDVSASANNMKKKKAKRKEPKQRVYMDPPARPRKKTGDGLVIYTEEELGFGKAEAGGTPLCPFDCDCCF